MGNSSLVTRNGTFLVEPFHYLHLHYALSEKQRKRPTQNPEDPLFTDLHFSVISVTSAVKYLSCFMELLTLPVAKLLTIPLIYNISCYDEEDDEPEGPKEQ